MNNPLPTNTTLPHTAGDCAGCGNLERRQFVQTAVASVATLLGLSLVVSRDAAAQIFALSAPPRGVRGNTTYQVPAADGVSIDTGNEVIIARSADTAYAFALSCPHQSTALRWNAKDHRFQCPKHQSKYSASGEFLNGRATRNMDRLAIRLEGGTLVVDTSREIRSDEEPAKWAAASVRLTG